ncbi:hypothetical protein GQ600_11190 [Phytophthora cactorum]|nr:hypothetical protein GQ600_11190 [Phytophthora cactorum]
MTSEIHTSAAYIGCNLLQISGSHVLETLCVVVFGAAAIVIQGHTLAVCIRYVSSRNQFVQILQQVCVLLQFSDIKR